ncbi:protein kinase [Clonorchis sinensis]|uniref:Protein kinase n=1 Tax=Clonorchis sinensis TaxID=79923 RepID=G7YFN6_CLOSI|nr:protein kinase [Clonorchis sinensis]
MVYIQSHSKKAEWRKSACRMGDVESYFYLKKGMRTLCENHQGTSLVAVELEVHSGLMLRRLIEHWEEQIRESQAGFRSARG